MTGPALRPFRARRIVQSVVVLAIAGLVVACDAVRVEERRGAFWDAFRFASEPDERSHFDSLEEMLAASDAVVTARVHSVHVSRVFDPGDGTGMVMPYLGVDLVIDRVIAGAAPAQVRLEFGAGGDADEAAAIVEVLSRKLPADSVVVFLHEKRGAGEAGLYRVTNSTGLWAPTARAGVDSPLRPEPPELSRLYAVELSGLADMNDLVELLVRLAGTTTLDGV